LRLLRASLINKRFAAIANDERAALHTQARLVVYRR
jgi:hypothetical protein